MPSTFHKQRPDGSFHQDGSYNTKYEPLHSSEVEIYDSTNPKAMVNVVPTWLKNRILSVSVQSLLQMSEEDLEKKVNPPLTLKRLRIAFWSEYERIFKGYGRSIQQSKREMNIGVHRMCNGICTPSYFMDKVARNDYFIAWVVRPPIDYATAMEEALQFGIERLREILNFPLYEQKLNKDGVPVVNARTKKPVLIPNVSVGTLMLKTVALLDMRVKGSIPHRVHQITQSQIDRRNVNVNILENHSGVQVDAKKLDKKLLTIEDLDKQIVTLTKETDQLLNNPKVNLREINKLEKQGDEEIEEHSKGLPYDSA